MRRRELSPALVELGIHDTEELERVNAIGARPPRARLVHEALAEIRAEEHPPAPLPLRAELSIRIALERGFCVCEDCGLPQEFLPDGKVCVRCDSARLVFEPPIF